MRRYRLSPKAQSDLDLIGRYVAERNLNAALRLHDALTSAFKTLSRQPLLGEATPELGRELRCFPVGNYVIYYRPEAGKVRIVRVIHGARDQKQAFDEPE
jgi:toxin ParE1/3/4